MLEDAAPFEMDTLLYLISAILYVYRYEFLHKLNTDLEKAPNNTLTPRAITIESNAPGFARKLMRPYFWLDAQKICNLSHGSRSREDDFWRRKMLILTCLRHPFRRSHAQRRSAFHFWTTPAAGLQNRAGITSCILDFSTWTKDSFLYRCADTLTIAVSWWKFPFQMTSNISNSVLYFLCTWRIDIELIDQTTFSACLYLSWTAHDENYNACLYIF